MKIIKKVFDNSRNYGIKSLVLTLLFPLYGFVFVLIRLSRLLRKSIILFNGNWGDYSGFISLSGLNNLFYWNRALNLYRYGRNGKSPYLGNGNYPLSRCFNYSFISLYSFWLAPLVTILLSMFIWLGTHFIWSYTTDLNWIILVVIASLLSTTFYFAIVLQNYNSVGWAFLPLFLFGLFTNNWLIATISLFLASLGSITVVLFGCVFAFVSCMENDSFVPILFIIPAIINIATHFIPIIKGDSPSTILINVMKAIGLTGKGVKYKREKSKSISSTFVYFTILYAQFILINFYFSESWNFYLIAGFAIHIINSLVFRFADVDSIRIMFLTLATAITINQPFLYPVLASYFLLASPVPSYLRIGKKNKMYSLVKAEPFNIRPLLNEMNSFIAPVKKDEKLFMAFNNPNNIYENIYDGYRWIIEIIHYCSNINFIHFVPDWWGIFELNFKEAPEYWGRDVKSVIKNINELKADYVIVYQDSGTVLNKLWEENNFEILSTFDWKKFENNFNVFPYSNNTPKWWLLKYKR